MLQKDCFTTLFQYFTDSTPTVSIWGNEHPFNQII